MADVRQPCQNRYAIMSKKPEGAVKGIGGNWSRAECEQVVSIAI